MIFYVIFCFNVTIHVNDIFIDWIKTSGLFLYITNVYIFLYLIM
ncbi:similar to KIAA0335, isoform CRA_b [Rattus norvegicus]|uniref:Similar to KIAA0335, isoform CRA_b n=1 Tax=Rattus norvegicus TaxID=10116 RepID=A6JH67_RAT|nr:similar to KIAA0335, isoform CRA_b [Rattus norvegicus]